MTRRDPPRLRRLQPADRPLGWVPYAWLVYLGGFVFEPLFFRRGPGYWAAMLLGLAVFVPAYLRSYRARGRALLGIVGLELGLGVALSFVNHGAAAFFIYASAAGANLERSRDALRVIAVATIVALGTAWAIDAQPWYWVTVGVFTPLIGAVNLHSVQIDRANVRLHLAQQEIEHLAAVAERERIARDLHDVLGHTLSLVTLKAQLAGRLVERDPRRAAKEIREVEQVARHALGEVRETIRGYRATLDEEIGRARTLLDAAGIRTEASIDLPTIDRARDDVLALVLREMVTNTARHSGATTCRIVAEEIDGGCRLMVEDDGIGGAVTEGSGLRGMRERIEALGGTFAYDGSSGARVTVTVPLPAERPSTPAAGRSAAG
jgi:two-component system sensor histidine kinase DesK